MLNLHWFWLDFTGVVGIAKQASSNKSQLIRDFVAKNPNAKPKAIAAELSKIDPKITPAYVSQIRTADRKRAGKKPGKRGPKPNRHDVGNPLLPQSGFAFALPIFKAANELLKVAGSKAVAREVLDMMAALRS